MRAKLQLRQEAQVLRKRGYSYTEIADKLGVSKSSISAWCRDILVPVRFQKRLGRMVLEGRARGRKKWADMRRAQKKEFLEGIAIETKKDIGLLSKRDRF